MAAPGDKRETHQEDVRECHRENGMNVILKSPQEMYPQIWAAGNDGGQD